MLPKIIEEKRQREARRRQRAGHPEAGSTGCICPPTSERTCNNPTCPRQDHRTLGQKMRDANG